MAPGVCHAELQAAYTSAQGGLKCVIGGRSFVLQVRNITIALEGTERISIGTTGGYADVNCRTENTGSTVRDWCTTWGESIDGDAILIRSNDCPAIVGTIGFVWLVRILGGRSKLIKVRLAV